MIQSLWNPFRDWNTGIRYLVHSKLVIQSLWNPFRDWNINRIPLICESIGIQSLWNPFRDWNNFMEVTPKEVVQIQSLWNPFRDWNLSAIGFVASLTCGFKASETLLGIETYNNHATQGRNGGFKASETLLGIETFCPFLTHDYGSSIQSLWNPFRDWNSNQQPISHLIRFRFKASETLLGIKTCLVDS